MSESELLNSDQDFLIQQQLESQLFQYQQATTQDTSMISQSEDNYVQRCQSFKLNLQLIRKSFANNFQMKSEMLQMWQMRLENHLKKQLEIDKNEYKWFAMAIKQYKDYAERIPQQHQHLKIAANLFIQSQEQDLRKFEKYIDRLQEVIKKKENLNKFPQKRFFIFTKKQLKQIAARRRSVTIFEESIIEPKKQQRSSSEKKLIAQMDNLFNREKLEISQFSQGQVIEKQRERERGILAIERQREGASKDNKKSEEKKRKTFSRTKIINSILPKDFYGKKL